jgi:hypothetical protein
MQGFTANPEPIVEVLAGAGAVAVKGYSEAVDAELRHGLISRVCQCEFWCGYLEAEH